MHGGREEKGERGEGEHGSGGEKGVVGGGGDAWREGERKWKGGQRAPTAQKIVAIPDRRAA